MIVAGGQTVGGVWLDTIEKFDFGNPGAGWTNSGKLPSKMGQPGGMAAIMQFEHSRSFYITGYSEETGHNKTIWAEYNKWNHGFDDYGNGNDVAIDRVTNKLRCAEIFLFTLKNFQDFSWTSSCTNETFMDLLWQGLRMDFSHETKTTCCF